MDNFFSDLSKSLEEASSVGKKISEERRANFQEYLVRSGVRAGLAGALKLLYQQPAFPKDPLDFIRSKLGQPRISTTQFKAMKEQLHIYLRRIEELEGEIAKAKLPQEEEEEEEDITGKTEGENAPDEDV